MTSAGLPIDPWEVEGRRLAPLLDQVSAVVIAASDPLVAAHVALGAARLQGQQRRVAIADLVGELPPIEALLTGDDPHGVADSFLYGVSLNKIARPMAGAENIFLMPSGTEAVDHEGVYANERWRRLAAGFHQVGALLIVIARPTSGGFGDLCAYIGALMPVGEWAFPTPVGVPLLAPPAPPPPPPVEPAAPTPRATKVKAQVAATQDADSRRRKLLAVLLVVLAVAVAGGAFWSQLVAYLPESVQSMLGRTPPPDTARMIVPPTPMDTVPRVDSAARDSATADSLRAAGDTTGATPAGPPLAVANPADSSAASQYAVYFATANTRAGAMPDARPADLEALALTPVPEGGETWFRVTVGAAPTREEAEKLLGTLRTKKLIGSGSIVRVPFALRLESNVAPSLVSARLAALTGRGIQAYALRQGDGSANVYTGAFESPAQATALADSLRATGVSPVLVYRTGRAF
ncbi:MAG: SPOR domain-containing protein [Gemmatimonadetes bacterium]|nr:SPOR domain-containing protein [Gemmatimonadota bacterium]